MFIKTFKELISWVEDNCDEMYNDHNLRCLFSNCDRSDH